MNKINLFFKEHSTKLILVLLILVYFKNCTVTKELNRLKKEVSETNYELLNAISKLPTSKDLQIEGLKSEKRMIQSTDRKIFDLKRQNEIEKELKSLTNN